MIVSLCTEFPRTGRQFHFATIRIKKYGAANVLQTCTFHMFRTVKLGKFFFVRLQNTLQSLASTLFIYFLLRSGVLITLSFIWILLNFYLIFAELFFDSEPIGMANYLKRQLT